MTHDRLYLKKTQRIADAAIDCDIVSDVTIYIQHNTRKEKFATRNKMRRTGPGSSQIKTSLSQLSILEKPVVQPIEFSCTYSKVINGTAINLGIPRIYNSNVDTK